MSRRWVLFFASQRPLLPLVLLLALLRWPCSAHAETTILYVDDDAPPGGNGRSWSSSYTYLQDALAAATTYEQAAVEIRIAGGSYKPDAGARQLPGDPSATFALLPRLTLNGGYAGLRFQNPDQRDSEAYPTVLSGDGTPPVYHVVTAINVARPCVLDALTITKGNAWAEAGADNPKQGGGLYAVKSNIIIRDCCFSDNWAGRYQDQRSGGGALFCEQNSTLLLQRSRFCANWGWYGGAIHANASRLTIQDCLFNQNNANSAAGAVYNLNGDTIVLRSRFEQNHSYWGGAGAVQLLSAERGVALILDSVFVGNQGLGGGCAGGGIIISGGNATMSNCRFSENISTYNTGGAVALWSQTARVLDCAFDRNSAGMGGAIDIRGSASSVVSIEKCTFASNSAYTGGAISLFPNDASITNCVFVGNHSVRHPQGHSGEAGAVWSPYSRGLRLTNSVFANNTSDGTGAVLIGGVATSVSNCTFVANSAFEGAAFQLNATDVAVLNSILWQNGTLDVDDIAGSMQYSLVDGNFAGEGNIADDPEFADDFLGVLTETALYDSESLSTRLVDANAVWTPGELSGRILVFDGEPAVCALVVENTTDSILVLGNLAAAASVGAIYHIYDYRLSAGSPCVDRGSPDTVSVRDVTDMDRDGDTEEPVPFDLAGATRIYGARVDMGAYEWRQDVPENRPPVCHTSEPIFGFCGLETATILVDASASFDPDGDRISYEWTVECPRAIVEDAAGSTLIVNLDLSEPCWLDFAVRLKVRDAVGNASQESEPVRIAPQISGPRQVLVSLGTGCTATLPDLAGKVFAETCLFGPRTKLLCTPTPGTSVGPGDHEMVITAADECGHAQSLVVTVSVQDPDLDGDGLGNCSDLDDDGDGVLDQQDNCPALANPGQEDRDGDTTGDACDAFPDDSSETIDSDADGIGDQEDPDDDGDQVSDTEDAFPKDPAEWQDTDGDATGDNGDGDDDGDGYPDEVDQFPLDALECCDSDGDRVGDNQDPDDDNDGTMDEEDAFPKDPAESKDTDADGIGNNVDPDDDNDGVNDEADAFPTDPTESRDTDADGFGDNGDVFPTDPTEWSDTDGDLTGDNRDDDDDNDGVLDVDDAFPSDAEEWADTDEDATGNNADPDDDGDGVADMEDTDPLSLKPSIEIVEAASDPRGHVQDWRAVTLDGELYRWKVLTLESQEETPLSHGPLSQYPGTILGIAADDAEGEPIKDLYRLRTAFIMTEMATLLSALQLSGDNESIPVGYWGDTVTAEDDTGETFAVMRSLLSKSAGSIGQSLEMNTVSGLKDHSARQKIWRDVALSVAVLRGLFSGFDEGENSAEACKDELYSWAERTHRLSGGARNSSKVFGKVADLGGAFSTQLIHAADFRQQVVDIVAEDLGLLELRSSSPAGSVAKRAAKLKSSMRNLSAALLVVDTVARYAGEACEALALQAIASAEGEDRICLLLRLAGKGVFSDPAAFQGVRDAVQSYGRIQQSFFDSWAEIRRQATVIESLDEFLDLIRTVGAAGKLFAGAFPNVAARMAQILPQMSPASTKVLGYSLGVAAAILDMAVALDSNLKLLRQLDLMLTMERELQVYLMNHKDLGDNFTSEEVLDLMGANEIRFHLKFLHFKDCLGLISSKGYDFYKIILLDIVGGLIWFQGLLHAKTMDEAIADYSEEKAHGKRKALELLEENGLMSRSLWVNLDRYLSSGLAPRSFQAVAQVDLTGGEPKWIYAKVDNHDSDVRSSLVSFSMPAGLRVVETDLDGLAGQWQEYPIGGLPIWHREDETEPSLIPVDTLWECSGPFAGQSTRYLGLRIAAQDDGVYWLRGRVSMLPSTSASDTRDAYLHAPEIGPRDQQGWETVEIDVLSRRTPAPNFIVKNGQPVVVARGQAFDLVVEMSNSGAPSLNSSFHVSHSSGLTLESVVPGSGWTHCSVGDLIWHADGGRIPASEPLSSHQMGRLGSGESLEYVLRFCAAEEGAHRVLLRCAMAGAGSTELLRFPNDEGALDQQGWLAIDLPIAVEENKPPVLVAAEPQEHMILKLPDEKVAFRVEAVDEDNRPESLSYSWSLDGAYGIGATPSIDVDIATLLQQGLLSIGVNHVVSVSVSDGLATRGKQWSLVVAQRQDLQVELEANPAVEFENKLGYDTAHVVSLEAKIGDPNGNETFRYLWASPRHAVTGRPLALVDGGGTADRTAVFATGFAAGGSATPYLVTCAVVGIENGASGVGTTEVLVEPSFLRGDANADGSIDISDPVTILGYLFLGIPKQLDCENTADADDKGSIELTDAIYLLGYLFLGKPPPPAPFPKCGADTSLDDLSCKNFAECP